MSSFKIRCPKCNRELLAKASMADRVVKCPKCEASMRIPSSTGSPKQTPHTEPKTSSSFNASVQVETEGGWGELLDLPNSNDPETEPMVSPSAMTPTTKRRKKNRHGSGAGLSMGIKIAIGSIVGLVLLVVLLIFALNYGLRRYESSLDLHMAVKLNRLDRVKELIDAGADLESRDEEFGHTPLMQAARLNRVEMLQLLLGAGADVNGTGGDDNMTPLAMAAWIGSEDEVFRILLDAGADLEARDNCDLTPLHSATMAESDSGRVIRFLVQAGADTEIRGFDAGYTPLHWAASNNALDAADALIAVGADVNASSNTGATPFDCAEGTPEMAALLHSYGGKTGR